MTELNSKSYESIDKIISSGRIPHAFLLEGEGDCGKQELAMYIAKACVCTGDKKPCGVCNQCLCCDASSNPDVITVTNEEGKKNITVAQIRDVRMQSFIKPHSADFKVFIIDNANLLNEQAQNAFLKVLEEPPEGVVFILIVPSRTAMLETVISRCTVISLFSNGEDSDDIHGAAKEFIGKMISGTEYEMLKILQPFEKDRQKTEKFFIALKEECCALIKSSRVTAEKKALDRLYRKCDDYISSLKTNVNLPLLFSAAVCKTKEV